MLIFIGFACFPHQIVFCVSMVNDCGERIRAGTALSIVAESTNIYILLLSTAE